MKELTAKALINFLKTQNPNALIALAADEEGNSFSLVADEQFFIDKIFMKKQFGSQGTYLTKEDISKSSGETVNDDYGDKINKADLAECLILFGT